MRDRYTVSLPIPRGPLSPNGRHHWAAKARATKNARYEGKMATLAAMSPIPNRRPEWIEASVSIRVVKPNRRNIMDDQNLIASCKAYIDGVCDAGLLVNDRGLRWGAVVWDVEPGIAKNRERVELTFVCLKESLGD